MLQTWNQNADGPDSPSLVSWMFDHEYPEQALNTQKVEALKGADKHRGLALLVDVTQSIDIAKMTEAANVFGIEGVRDVYVIPGRGDMCVMIKTLTEFTL